MTPLWIFTLGKTIFDRGNLRVPYGQIASSVFGLIIPLCIGLLIQRYYPRVARFLVRILKTCSALLILFIVIFAILTNLYLFQLFTWEVRHFLSRLNFEKFQTIKINIFFLNCRLLWLVYCFHGLVISSDG